MEKVNYTFAAVVGVLLFVIQVLLNLIPKLAILAAATQCALTILGCGATAILLVKFLLLPKNH